MSILAGQMSEEEKNIRIEMIERCLDCHHARWQGDVCKNCGNKNVKRRKRNRI